MRHFLYPVLFTTLFAPIAPAQIKPDPWPTYKIYEYAKRAIEARPKVSPAFRFDLDSEKCLDPKGKSGHNPAGASECADNNNGQFNQKDFSAKNLRGADFSESMVKGANFSFADLRGANLDFSNYKGANFKGALYSAATHLPFDEKKATELGMQLLPQSLLNERFREGLKYVAGKDYFGNLVALGANPRLENNLALATALKNHDKGFIDFLIGVGVSIDENTVQGPALYHVGKMIELNQGDAATWLSFLDYLLTLKPNLNFEFANQTPLTIATRSKPIQFAKKLLAAGANPNFTGTFTLPLVEAIAKKDGEKIDLLFNYQANPNLCSGTSESPLAVAIRNGKSEQLLKAGADINRICEGKSPLAAAVESNQPSALTELLKRKANLSKCNKEDSCSILELALVGRQYPLIIRPLLEAGADASWNKGKFKCLLDYATGKVLLGELIQAGADPKAAMLSHRRDLNSIEFLLDRGAAIDQKDDLGRTLLINLALDKNLKEKNRFDLMHLLLQRKANANIIDKQGFSAFSFLAYRNYGERFYQLLLDHQASADFYVPQERYNHRTGKVELLLRPAAVWALEKKAAMFESFLKHGSNVNRPDPVDGLSAFLKGFRFGAVDFWEKMVKAGGDVNSAMAYYAKEAYHANQNNLYGGTKHHEAVFRFLIEKGAEFKNVKANGVPFFQFAMGMVESDAFLDELRNAGADLNARDAFGQSTLYHLISNLRLNPSVAKKRFSEWSKKWPTEKTESDDHFRRALAIATKRVCGEAYSDKSEDEPKTDQIEFVKTVLSYLRSLDPKLALDLVLLENIVNSGPHNGFHCEEKFYEAMKNEIKTLYPEAIYSAVRYSKPTSNAYRQPNIARSFNSLMDRLIKNGLKFTGDAEIIRLAIEAGNFRFAKTAYNLGATAPNISKLEWSDTQNVTRDGRHEWHSLPCPKEYRLATAQEIFSRWIRDPRMDSESLYVGNDRYDVYLFNTRTEEHEFRRYFYEKKPLSCDYYCVK